MKNKLNDLIRRESILDLPDEMLNIFIKLYCSNFKCDENSIDNIDPFKIAFACDAAYELILNFCHIDELPRELYYFWAKKSFSEFLISSVSRLDNLDDIDRDRAVKRLQEGDVSIEYDTDDSKSIALSLADYYGLWGEAIRFRKLVW